jgi:hypothetical protein
LTDHQKIIEFTRDYQRQVDFIIRVFRHKYNTTDLLESWHLGVYEPTGSIKEFGIERYYFHGIGLAAKIKGAFVDFDFSDYPDTRHDGFDARRLHKFAEGMPENTSSSPTKKF